jgi:hypothetical protein
MRWWTFQQLSRISSRLSTQPNRTAWALACRSAVRSSRRTGGACGRAAMRPAAPSFNSPCPAAQTSHRVSDARRHINKPRRRRISKDTARKSISLVAMLLASTDKPSRSRPGSALAITTDPKCAYTARPGPRRGCRLQGFRQICWTRRCVPCNQRPSSCGI